MGEFLTLIGMLGAFGGASAFAVAKIRANRKKSWVEQAEQRRMERRFSEQD